MTLSTIKQSSITFSSSQSDLDIDFLDSDLAQKIFVVAAWAFIGSASLKIYSMYCKKDADWYASLAYKFAIAGVVLLGAAGVAELYHQNIKNEELSANKAELSAENTRLSRENTQLNTENRQLSAKNTKLNIENTQLGTENNSLVVKVEKLQNRTLEQESIQSDNIEVIIPDPLNITYPEETTANIFTVSTNDIKNIDKIKDTARDWKQRISDQLSIAPRELLAEHKDHFSEKVWISAIEKYAFFPKKEFSELPIIVYDKGLNAYTNVSDDDESSSVFMNLRHLIEGVAYYSKEVFNQGDSSERRTIVTLNEGRVQGMAVFNAVTGYVDLLTSHPDNIPHIKNQNRTRGAGTSIILYLAKWALKTGKDITLNPLESAIPFYKRLGFTRYNKREHGYHQGYPGLILTVNTIKKLIENNVFPFSLLRDAKKSA